MAQSNDKSVKRYRNFGTIVYPDSAPVNWLSILEDTMIPCFVSPLHDKDVLPNGDPKKSHYHIIIMFDGPKTKDQAIEVFDLINGVGCEIVKSLRGNARYLCHLDNADKYRYQDIDVVSLSGADYSAVISLASDKYFAIAEMTTFINANCIYSFNQFFDYCRDNRYDWFRMLCDNSAYAIREYISSMYWTDTVLANSDLCNK